MITKQEVIDAFATNPWDEGDRYDYTVTPRIYKHKTNESLTLHYSGIQNSKLFENSVCIARLFDNKIYMGDEIIYSQEIN